MMTSTHDADLERVDDRAMPHVDDEVDPDGSDGPRIQISARVGRATWERLRAAGYRLGISQASVLRMALQHWLRSLRPVSTREEIELLATALAQRPRRRRRRR